MLPFIVISDTSCLILLDKINYLYLLKEIFFKVYTTPQVAAEFGLPLPAWIEVKEAAGGFENIVSKIADIGEASAITLAREFSAKESVFIILDDLKARKIALSEKLNVIGSMGIIVKAKELGIIPSVKPVFELVKRTNFRLSEDLEKKLLQFAGE